MMFATIRHDPDATWAADELARAGRSLTAALGDVAGFISCALLDTGDGGLVSIAICEDRVGLEEARQILDRWLSAHLAPAPGDPGTVISGEVIVQRGL
jgi:hypothetical protein